MYKSNYVTPNEKSSKYVLLKGINNKLTKFNSIENSKWEGSFNFIQMADTQFGLTENFKTNRDDKWDVEIAYTKRCIDVINNLKPLPEFAIICGDMINSFPSQMYRKEQISDFFKIFQRLLPSIPLVCVCGNHDVGNTPTPETIEEYRKDFGDDYMEFWVKGVKFIVLNSQYYSDRSCCEEEADKHDKWLDETLNSVENKSAKHIVVFQHIPWFITDFGEAEQYFNIKYETRKEMLEKLSHAGVSKIFAGHCHKNAGGWYEGPDGRSIEMIVTSAVGYQLGEDQHGFRVVTVNESDITHKYIDIFLDN